MFRFEGCRGGKYRYNISHKKYNALRNTVQGIVVFYNCNATLSSSIFSLLSFALSPLLSSSLLTSHSPLCYIQIYRLIENVL